MCTQFEEIKKNNYPSTGQNTHYTLTVVFGLDLDILLSSTIQTQQKKPTVIFALKRAWVMRLSFWPCLLTSQHDVNFYEPLQRGLCRVSSANEGVPQSYISGDKGMGIDVP